MQITIHQLEIEAAIRNYILTQLHVREDMKILVDLKATRGETGYQAIIDIIPDAPTPPTNKTAKSKTEPKAASNLNIAGKVSETKTATKSVVLDEPVEEETIEQVQPQGEETGKETETGAEMVAAAPKNSDMQEETPAPRSIFGNLKKVSNS